MKPALRISYGQNHTSGGREVDEHEASSEEVEVFQGPVPRGEANIIGRHLAPMFVLF